MEAALNEFTRFLDEEVASLEDETALALHDLTHKVSRESLETVKSTKSTVNGLFSRVSKVREELERLLDDDEDMFSMYLQDREDMPNAGNSAHLQSPIPGHSVESIDINSPTYDYANTFARRRSKKRMNKSKLASHASAVPFYEVWAEKEVDGMKRVITPSPSSLFIDSLRSDCKNLTRFSLLCGGPFREQSNGVGRGFPGGVLPKE